MNGKIQVSSEVGNGTSFEILLPIRKNAIQSENEQNTTLSNTPKISPISSQPVWASTGFDPNIDRPTLLIVEDNFDLVEYLTSCLEDLYQIELAHNGQEGIDKALELIPDLIISDVMMPEKYGFELCDTLKQDIRTSHIPIILLTAKADIDSRISGYSRGADAYLTKPFHQEELLVRVKNLLDIRLALQERYRNQIPEEPAPESFPLEDGFMRKVREILEVNLENSEFNIPSFCQQIGLSRSQLHKKIKALTGHSTSYIIRKYRLEKAQELLSSSNMNVAEVAYSVGFSDPSYFSRSFAELFGYPPSSVKK